MSFITLPPLIESFKKEKLLHFSAGSLIIRSGENPNHLFLLNKGAVRKYFVSSAGHEHTVTLYKVGDFFPWSKLLDQFPNDFYYEALTPIEVYAKPYKEIETLLKKNATISFNLFLNRINLALEDRLRIDLGSTGNAYIKTLLTILYLAEVMGQAERDRGVVCPHISQEKIASIPGLSRERISLEMEKMKKKNLIGYDTKNLKIPSLKKLREEISNAQR